MRSIRSFLLRRLLGGAALVLAVAGAAAYLIAGRSLEAQFDQNLQDRIEALASLLFQEGRHVEFEFADELMPEYGRARDAEYFELRHADGTLLERSNSLAGRDLPSPPAAEGSPALWTARLPDGRRGRYAARTIEVHHVLPEDAPDRPRAERVRIVVARGLEELLAAQRRVLATCAAGSLLLVGVLAGGAWLSVRRGLAPARRLAAAVGALRVERLPATLDVARLPAELRPVAETLEELVRRVDTALRRERRTTADIAHELRTPVSEILTVAEVALRQRRSSEGDRRALETVRDVAWRMGRTVATLLELARLQAGEPGRVRIEEVDLGALLTEGLRPLAAQQREREIVVEWRVPPRARVRSDGEAVRIVLSNLLGNALTYAPRGGTVRCTVEAGEGWSVAVANQAPGLVPADLESIGEPFWRKDGARADRERTGLGLALSRALAARAALELSFVLEDGSFVATLRGADTARRGSGTGSAGGGA